MARLVAPIHGGLVRDGDRLTTPFGHDLLSPLWKGAETGFLESRRAVEETVAAVLARLGARRPLSARPSPHVGLGAFLAGSVGGRAGPLCPRERLRELSHRVLAELEEEGERSGMRIILELDGPNRHFFAPSPAADLC